MTTKKLPDKLNAGQIFNLLTELPKDFLSEGRQNNPSQDIQFIDEIGSTLTEWASAEDDNAYRKL